MALTFAAPMDECSECSECGALTVYKFGHRASPLRVPVGLYAA